MIEYITERQKAEKKVETIKAAVVDSLVDYKLIETPYKLSIHLKKKNLQDHSQKTTSLLPVSSVLTISSDNSFANTSPSSVSSNLNDSGISQKCMSCDNMEKNVDDTRKQLVSSILEAKQKMNALETNSAAKDARIKQLEKKLNNIEEENMKIKQENENKNYQLKEKNKSYEKLRNSFEQEKKNNDFDKNKISNLETIVKNLNIKLQEKNEALKQEKNKLKNMDKKKKVKTKSTETESFPSSTKSFPTQTEKPEMKSVGTSPLFTKINLLGDPTHDVACLCLCHNEAAEACACEVQLFQYTIDPEEALDSLYYREDYTNLSDYDDYCEEENRENEAVHERLLHLKSMISDDELMKEMIGDSLKTILSERSTLSLGDTILENALEIETMSSKPSEDSFTSGTDSTEYENG